MTSSREEHDFTTDGKTSSHSSLFSQVAASLASTAAELAKLTHHLRQLTAVLAQEVEEQRAAPPSVPLSAGQLSTVSLAEDGLTTELRRHCSTWHRVGRQLARLQAHVRPHLWQRLQRRQAAVRADIVTLLRTLENAVSLLLALTACHDYSNTDAAHIEKLLRLVCAVHEVKNVLLAASRRQEPPLPGLRLYQYTFSAYDLGALPSVEELCERLAAARAVRLAAALESRMTGAGVDVSGLLRQWRAGAEHHPPSSLPPIVPAGGRPTERGSPTSGYASSAGEPDPGRAEVAAPPVDLQRVLGHEENVVRSLLLAAGRVWPLRADAAEDAALGQPVWSCNSGALARLYRDAVWRFACDRASQCLLWRTGGNRRRPPLAAVGGATSLVWLHQVHDQLKDNLWEFGVSPVGPTCRLRQMVLPSYVCFLLAPALRQSHDTRPVPVLLEGGDQCTRCGKLYYDAIRCVLDQLSRVEAELGTLSTDGQQCDHLVPLLHLQLTLQRQLRMVLHQLDMWVASRGQVLLSSWQTAAYFLVTLADLPRCIQLIDSLESSRPLDAIASSSPELEWCSTERAESNRLLDAVCQRLQQSSCTANLASVSEACRGMALASLSRLVPGKQYWRRAVVTTSQPSNYVRPFIEEVLEEVLGAASRLGSPLQATVGALVVKVTCLSWMEYFLQRKFIFSVAGARQLSRDAAALRRWLRHHRHLSDEARAHLLAVDALRELEGVASLLQRQPSDPRLNQVAPAARPVTDSPLSDNIPSEMYVRERAAWLSLRLQREDAPMAVLRRLLVCRCCMWPN